MPEPGPSLSGVELRLVEARGGVALDSIDESLEGANANPVVAESGGNARVGQASPLVERRTREHTHGELAAAMKLPVHRELKWRRDVVDGGDAELGQVALRGARFTEPLVERLRRDRGAHSGEGGIGDASGGATVHALEAMDGSVARQFGALERDGVCQPGAPVPTIEQHRRGGAHRVDDRAVGGEAPARLGTA
jgi:hypothetical protein